MFTTMKNRLLACLIIFGTVSSAYCAEADYQKLLDKVDVSNPHYGKDTFGRPKINVFRSQDNSLLLVYQARYGGDGDHTENLLKLFKFTNDKAEKLLDQNIDSVEFIEEANYLNCIRGKYVETLCDVCDGWEVSDPEDIFFIPIIIDIKTLKITPELKTQDKESLLSRFEQRAKKNIAEQLSYGNKDYPGFVDSMKKRINKLLNGT